MAKRSTKIDFIEELPVLYCQNDSNVWIVSARMGTFRCAGCHWDFPSMDVKSRSMARDQDRSDHFIKEMTSFFGSTDREPAIRTKSYSAGGTDKLRSLPTYRRLTMVLPTTTKKIVNWTPIDQRIIEHLLLDQSDVEDPENSSSSRNVKLSTIIVEKKHQQKSTKRSDSHLKKVDRGKATQVEEDRRDRHRAVQRRYIKRRKAEAKHIKLLVQTLEDIYCCLEIAAEERDLKLENGKLRARVDAVAAYVPRVPHVDPIQLLMQNQLELVKEFYEPLTSQDLVSIQQAVQVEYELSRRDNTYQTSGASVMGWSDFRKMDESSVKFMLSKGFPNVQALHLMNVTWDTLSLPATYATFFSPAFPIKTQVLQVVGRDAVVIHRVLFNPHTQSSSNSLELLWRVRLGEEYAIFDSALQHNAVQQCLGASYKWSQMTTSLGFAPLDVNRVSGCVLRHGGWIRASVQNVDFWFKEMFFMALRFESTMVAPVFALSYEN